MVKRLLTAMGGWIEAHNLEAGGTEMRFWIPLIQEGEEEQLQVEA